MGTSLKTQQPVVLITACEILYLVYMKCASIGYDVSSLDLNCCLGAVITPLSRGYHAVKPARPDKLRQFILVLTLIIWCMFHITLSCSPLYFPKVYYVSFKLLLAPIFTLPCSSPQFFLFKSTPTLQKDKDVIRLLRSI